jgi:hypothetical protein
MMSKSMGRLEKLNTTKNPNLLTSLKREMLVRIEKSRRRKK